MGQPDTRPTLLMQLRDPKEKTSWSRFAELYAPLVHDFLRKRGVQDADAADLTQEVMMSVAQAIRSFEYDPERGGFRHWLLTIVHNQLRNFWRKNESAERGAGGTPAQELLMEQPETNNGQTADWDQAYERQMFQFASDQVREHFQESTWLAFWRTAVEGKSAREVSKDLGMSVAAVYMAKRRVVGRIKEQIVFLEGESK